MQNRQATAIASPNIALIKYWGNRDHGLRLPSNPSLSMNLAGLETRTTVAFDAGLRDDEVVIGGVAQSGAARRRNPMSYLTPTKEKRRCHKPTTLGSKN